MSSPSSAVHNPDHHDHPAAPLPLYFAVYGALLFLTILTVLVSLADLGSAALMVAMAVATVKATLVLTYFMHLKGSNPIYTLIFVSTLMFVGTFFLFTFIDLTTRDRVIDEEGSRPMQQDNRPDYSLARPEGAHH